MGRFLIYLVSLGRFDGLQIIVLFGTCFLANSVKQVVTFQRMCQCYHALIYANLFAGFHREIK